MPTGNWPGFAVILPTAVGFVPGTASMEVQVYDVGKNRVAYEKHFEVTVGVDDESTDIFTDRESTKRALVKKILRQWQIVFIGKPDFS